MPKIIVNTGFSRSLYLPKCSRSAKPLATSIDNSFFFIPSSGRNLFYFCLHLCSELKRSFFVNITTITQNLLFTHSVLKSQF